MATAGGSKKSKKTTAKKAKVKKTPAKKAAKKTTKKKVAPKKKAIKKVAVVKQKLSEKEELMQKTGKRDALKSSVMKDLCKDCDRPAVESQPLKPSLLLREVHLAVLSPNRYPLNYSQVTAQTARFVGMAFVLIGAFFTAYGASAIVGYNAGSIVTDSQAQLAQLPPTVDSESGCDLADVQCMNAYYGTGTATGGSNIDPVSGCDFSDTDCMDDFHSSSGSGSGGTSGSSGSGSGSNHTPDVDIDVKASEPLQGDVLIEIDVANANSVRMRAYNTFTQSMITLGFANQVSSDDWEYTWDTTSVPDAEYTVVAFVQNPHGGYEEHSDDTYQVENNPFIDTGSSSGSGSTATLLEIYSIDIDNPDTVSGVATVDIETDDVEQVKILLEDTTTQQRVLNAQAHERNDGSWRFNFDSTRYSDGEYRLRVQAISDSSDVAEDWVNITIVNNNEVITNAQQANDTDSTGTSPVLNSDFDTLLDSIEISIAKQSPLSGFTPILISIPEANFVEVHAIRKNAATPLFLGLARQNDTDQWELRWDTRSVPNGEYEIYATARNSYGLLESDFIGALVFNEVTTDASPQQTDHSNTLQTIAKEEDSNILFDPQFVDEQVNADVLISDDDPEIAPEVAEVTNDLVTTVEEETTVLLTEQKSEIDKKLKQLAVAIRNDDEELIDEIREELSTLRENVKTQTGDSEATGAVIAAVDRKFSEAIERVEEDIAKTNRIIEERTGDVASKDSDRDGIADYDEVNLYGTDPFSADSDGDGFNDGAEILGGFDPADDTPETLVKYESPKDVGVVREDLLVVEEIVSVPPLQPDTDGVRAEAVISGKALPNSFITLYIFSTPIVVTVKTDSDGSWSYRFDKELEDGEHEVYVGITDNAGKIVAKSNPLTFVKTAEAFSAVEAAASGATIAPTTQPEASFLSQNMFLIVTSLIVLALGLVLMMIGMHMQPHIKPEELVVETQNG